tara:strand:- start:72 stop:836 length:765 start_codon:yes stop_codon:yes gene_type:complete
LIITNKKIALLIGGAGDGYGKQILETLIENNYFVIITSRDITKLSKIKKKYSNHKDLIFSYKLNLENNREITKTIKDVKSKFKKIDILINNAAANCLKPFKDQNYNDWKEILNINVVSNIQITKEAIKLMSKKNISRIINISSIYGIRPPKHHIYGNSKINSPLIYGTSKAALIYFTQYFATILPKNFRINCVSPGGLESNQPKDFKSRYNKYVPLKRMANQNDLKGLIRYLISEESNYMTGQNLILDGGWTLS